MFFINIGKVAVDDDVGLRLLSNEKSGNLSYLVTIVAFVMLNNVQHGLQRYITHKHYFHKANKTRGIAAHTG